MDIHKWLDETVFPEEPPTLPEQLGLPLFFHRKESAEEQPPQKRRRIKRSTSDSSLLDTCLKQKKTPPIEHEADIEESAGESTCSEASDHSGHSSGSTTSSHQYARRPRRKTRLDHYDPKSKDAKRRGKQVSRREKGESRKAKRKSRREKTDKPGAGLVRSFHAKNVPIDRLTLKPREKLGIFNKGKASSPVRGRGLPDLVFSEMKFLQKHRGQPEVTPRTGAAQRKRKKDHAQAKQEEISAYFTSSRPVLAEKDVNTQAKGEPRRRSLVPDLDHKPARSTVIDNAIPTVELPEKPSYLGFGSTGPRHESGNYISWSESIRAPSTTPIHRQAVSTVDVGQLDPIHGRRACMNMDAENAVQSLKDQTSIVKVITDGSGERFDVSSLAPADHHVSRSHSFPIHSRSPRPLNQFGQVGRHVTKGTATYPSSMPASVPHHGDTNKARNRRVQIESYHGSITTSRSPASSQLIRRQTEPKNRVTDDVDPQTSSTLGRLLRECDSTFIDRRHQEDGAYDHNCLEVQPPAMPDNERRMIYPGSYVVGQQGSSVRIPRVDLHRPRLPMLAGPSIYEEQAQRQTFIQEPHVDDRQPMEESYMREREYDSGDFVFEYYDQELGAPQDETAAYELGVGPSGEGFVLSYPVEESVEQSATFVTGGFWRPHKLY
ncbi:hypothetical protein K469DRAFT_571033 [Zopfia rhizophila CBS 207.26]|uniref:Uncharacterized protein n=1 Tax=Zopfia rhizophila CBS 207.26 TaxID=1314779 RepID=A0A6A6E4K2_9PEZI|nr:hypothetical protein K469DRAFT_571033 [Zopfia rhizophila CBS 207.26]